MIPFRHKWDIENIETLFSNENLTGHPRIISSIFSPTNQAQHQFSIVLYPKGRDSECHEFFSLFLVTHSVKIETAEKHVQFKFSILDCRGVKSNTKATLYRFTNENTVWGFAEFILRKLIFDSKLVSYNKLTLLCEGEIIKNGSKLSDRELMRHFAIFEDKLLVNVPQSQGCFNTQTSKIQFAHQWTIDNFTSLFTDQITGHPYLKSNQFSPNDLNQYQFVLKLYPKSNNERTEQYLSLYLESHFENQGTCRVQYKLSIIDSNGSKYNTKVNKQTFLDRDSSGFSQFVLRESLSNLQNGNRLILLCEGEILEEYDKMSTRNSTNHYPLFKADKQSWSIISKNYFNANLRTIPFTYEWSISLDNFNQRTQENQNFIESSKFGPNLDHQFNLRLYPIANQNDNISIHVMYLSETQITIQHRVTLLDREGRKVKVKCNISTFTKQENYTEYSKFLSLDATFKSGLLPNDKLTFLFEAEVVLNAEKLTERELRNYYNIFRHKQFDIQEIANLTEQLKELKIESTTEQAAQRSNSTNIVNSTFNNTLIIINSKSDMNDFDVGKFTSK